MIITCEQCQARFRLADDKLKAGGTKVRCSKCKHIFSVFPPEDTLQEEPAELDAAPPAKDEIPDEAPPQPESWPEATAPEPQAAATGDEMDLDFSGLEETMGPGSGGGEVAEEFSFADSSTPAPEPEADEPAGSESAETGTSPSAGYETETPGEFDFGTAFTETESPTASDAGTAEPTEFAFSEPTSAGDEPTDGDEDAGGFNFDSGLSAGIGEEFSFDGGQPETGNTPDQEPDVTDNAFAFGEETPATDDAGAFSFGDGDSGEASPFDTETPFGSDPAPSWETQETGGGSTFEFDEPSFETKAEDKSPAAGNEGNSLFGEIDFSDRDGGAAAPSSGPGLDFEQATMARPPEPEAPPAQPAPTPRPEPRPRREEPLPIPKRPAKKPASQAMLVLVLLFLAISGAAGYFYYMGNGRQFIESLVLKAKGEAPVVQVAPDIAVTIDSSAYVDNRATGQLLVIQGTVTNNSPGSRSAITVKGMLLDAAGKVIQQQTVFCGNYMGEDKLRTMKYAQIEEAMNNQFGDSLLNMNVKQGGTLQYSIVFRNVPKEMANIAVDYADSKPGDGG